MTIGSGVPAAAYCLSAELAEQVQRLASIEDPEASGVGGTPAGNALSLAAIRANWHTC